MTVPARIGDFLALITIGSLLCVATPGAGQVLETESARSLPRGTVKLGGNVEVQTSSEGQEFATPLTIEFGVTDRLELLVEPVAAARIRPNAGPRARSVGDTEVTALYLVRPEHGRWPALSMAGEVKLPTAKNALIGTGKTDVAGILIASKRLGAVDTHANVSYTVVGQPAGLALSNIVGGAFAAQIPLGRRMQAFAEALASTSTGAGEGEGRPAGTAIVAEAAGQELVGTVGAGVYIHPKVFLSFGISYDNNGAVLFRPGITFRSR